MLFQAKLRRLSQLHPDGVEDDQNRVSFADQVEISQSQMELVMPVEMVLTIISKDRPGLVQTLAQVIADHSGNWIDSSMARLGGEFAGILRVDVSEGRVASFEKSLAALAEHGIAVTVRRDSAAPRSHGRRVHLNLTGADHPGIIRERSGTPSRQHR